MKGVVQRVVQRTVHVPPEVDAAIVAAVELARREGDSGASINRWILDAIRLRLAAPRKEK